MTKPKAMPKKHAASKTTEGGKKKKQVQFVMDSGLKADLDIQRERNSSDLAIPKATFTRNFRNLVKEMGVTNRFTSEAVVAIQEVSEAFLVSIFEDTEQAAKHCKRKTIQVEDMQLVADMRIKRRRF